MFTDFCVDELLSSVFILLNSKPKSVSYSYNEKRKKMEVMSERKEIEFEKKGISYNPNNVSYPSE